MASCVDTYGLLTVPRSRPKVSCLLWDRETFGRRGGTVRRPCHNCEASDPRLLQKQKPRSVTRFQSRRAANRSRIVVALSLWHGLLTVPRSRPKVSCFSERWETCGRRTWHGQETVPHRWRPCHNHSSVAQGGEQVADLVLDVLRVLARAGELLAP